MDKTCYHVPCINTAGYPLSDGRHACWLHVLLLPQELIPVINFANAVTLRATESVR